MIHLLSDEHRWKKLAAALVLLVGLGLLSGLGMPVVRPSVFRYESRADEYNGRTFALDYLRVRAVHAGYFTVRARLGAGLRFTDTEHLSALERDAAGGPPGETVVCGTTVHPGDSVSVKGTFRKPDLMILEEVRIHYSRDLKYATAVPAVLVLLFAAWRGLRRSPEGLALRDVPGRRR